MSALPRKVLMTADTLGGVWTFAIDLCAALAKRNVEVMLLSMGRMPDEAQQRQADELPNLRLVATAHRLEWMQDCGADVVESGSLLLDLARRFQPDVAHINGYYHAALPFDAPVVLTAHSCVASWWKACRQGPLPGEWQPYMNWAAAAVRHADLLAAPTEAYLDVFQALHGRARRAAAIANGSPPALFNAGVKQNMVLAAGRLWDDAKNISVVCNAAQGLDAPVTVAGDEISPEGTAAALPNVSFAGRLNRQEMARRMAQAKVFVSPARYEPFGLTVLEAALSGCALVLADIPTFRELWNGAAIFVDADDENGWRKAMALLLKDGELARSCGERARRRAAQYSADRMAAAYHNAYSTVLGSGRGSPALEAAA